MKRNISRISIYLSAIIALSGLASSTLSQPYDHTWYSIDGGGACPPDVSVGGTFELSGTIGQPDAGGMSGGSFTLTGGFWSAASAGLPPVPGDCDGDGDVDLMDYGDFASCLNGPVSPLPPACDCFDLDGDGDADLADFAGFQVGLTG